MRGMRGGRGQRSPLARWVLTPYLGREASRSVHSERTIIHRPKSQNCHFPLTAQNHTRHPPLIHACSIFVARPPLRRRPPLRLPREQSLSSLPAILHSPAARTLTEHRSDSAAAASEAAFVRSEAAAATASGADGRMERARARERKRKKSITHGSRKIRATLPLSLPLAPFRVLECEGTEGGREGDQLPCGTARYGSGGSFVATFCREIQRRSGGVA